VTVTAGSAIVDTETRFFDEEAADAFVVQVECCAVDRMYKDEAFTELGTIQLLAASVQRLQGSPPPSAAPPPNRLRAGLLPVRRTPSRWAGLRPHPAALTVICLVRIRTNRELTLPFHDARPIPLTRL
jgi:hypothetical protein